MPYSELSEMAKGKVDVNQQKPTYLSTDHSFSGDDNECFELVWQNGEITLQGQSCKIRTNSQDGKDQNDSKMPKFSTMDSVLNDFPLSAPLSEMGLDADIQDIAPWLNNLHELDLCANNHILNNSSAANAPSVQQECTTKVAFSAPELDKLRISETCPSMQNHNPLPRLGNPDKLSSNSGLLNFPYFSRFASLSRIKVVGDEKRGSTKNSHNQEEPTLVKCSNQESGSRHLKLSVPPSAEGGKSLNPEPDSLVPQQSEALRLKGRKNDRSADHPSSVCSVNILGPSPSNLLTSELKRKSHEIEDSEGPSDEAEEESVSVRKTASNHSSSKRSRSAAVHNLSERKRRDRINEKMRELKELIPNCDKMDKASLLDDAIEYMKTLQLQLQILSIGNGMCMSPMMQQAQRAYVPQFSSMGITAGFGMGMHDANYNMMSLHNIQGSGYYPVPGNPFSNPMFHGALSSGHQTARFAGQELLMSMPCAPLPMFGNPPMKLPIGNVAAMPNGVMNDKSNQGTEFVNDQYQPVNAGEAPKHS